ncbi:hypothetical protein VC218_11415 [Xanthomonas nasturtii]|uniref:hypothetical protein n=1 Tax=Xanthomonas nasturtii TaxID=1843581 RepID=UPI002B2261A9|nr:hypothetical protein [Xanthomonas nasturtii]MEA9579495.1 hypothetical protein [Xanthomonas nasturtii]
MKAIIAIILALSPVIARSASDVHSCRAWTQEIIAGKADACADLCPQAKTFDHYDYRQGVTAAFQTKRGLASFLAYLDRSTIIGAGAETHACSVRALLEHWGDKAFSQTLRRQTKRSQEQAISLIDYAELPRFQQRFPQTYLLASHE